MHETPRSWMDCATTRLGRNVVKRKKSIMVHILERAA
jgi:hypothetical protein